MDGEPPLLSVFGGKITTYRKLAEHALIKLKPFFPAMGGDWTAAKHLPGGDMPGGDFDGFFDGLKRNYSSFRKSCCITTRAATALRRGRCWARQHPLPSLVDILAARFTSGKLTICARWNG